MGYDETVFYKDQKIAVSELGPHIRELRFSEFMIDYSQSYFPNTSDKTCDNFAVVWCENDDEVYINQIYNHDTGEIFFDESEEMTDEVDNLISSILMYANLEQTIDGAYSWN